MTTRRITLANRDGAIFEVDARRPLLDSLREQGVDLPYGCHNTEAALPARPSLRRAR